MTMMDVRRVHEIESIVSDFTKSEVINMIVVLQEEREHLRSKLNLVKEVIADDSHAISFQTLGQYRSSLLNIFNT